MASITYDGQSFLLDGRRVWLVSGTIHPARVPRAQWADRIHAAKQAGLNCIEMPVVWSRHEPRHGQFDWTGENDVREFARLIREAGLWCILRAGPFIDGGYDMGGLPPWLLTIESLKLRTANQPFLEACSRYITALAGQLRDMQVSSPVPKGGTAPAHPGPIIMLRTEGGFTCGDDQLAHTYLGELDRYWREAGFNVPLINSNDLWQSVEGEIDGWTGYDALLSHLRQLGTIRPAQPRIVIDFQLGSHDTFGEPAADPKPPGAVLRRLAEVLAAGGQFNISPFHGGTNFGFSAGRDITRGPAGFPTASADAGAPVSETGVTTAQYPAVRRICTFASRFNRVLSHLDPARQPVALLPEAMAAKAGETGSRVSVIHAVGSQGGVVFVFGDDAGANNPAPMSLLLPDGSTLPVDLGDQSVVWCLLDTRLSGRANLDYCNLCAMALVGKVFVCFGAPGARAALSINGSPLETTVPEGKNPIVQEHESVTVVIASMAQIDRIFFDDHGVFIGINGLDSHGKPITDEETKSYTHIDAEGKQTTHKVAHNNHPKRSSRITLGDWVLASLSDYAMGASPRFASIQKPTDLVGLGAPYGYGWYRLKLPSGSPKRVKLMFPQSAHRLHIIQEGEPIGIMGLGNNTTTTLPINLKKGANTFVILAENAGRVSAGADLGEATGISGHGWEVEPIKPAKPKLVPADPVDILAFRAPLWKMHRDDRSDAVRLTWTIQHRSKNPIIMEIGAFEEGLGLEREGGIVLLNGKPIHYFQQGGVRPFIIPAEVLLKGNNEVQITLLGQTDAAADALGKAVHFYDALDMITAKAEWSFAKWEPPAAGKFGKNAKHKAGEACWWKCEMTVAPGAEEGSEPVLIDCAGLTKGQIYLNGKHLCRYFVAGSTGRRNPPQQRYVVPRSWLKPGANDLMIFDEHGATPSRVRIINDAKGGAFDR